MRRLQVHLTDVQVQRIRQLSEDLGVSRSAAIRSVLDRALGTDAAEAAARAVIEATAGVLQRPPAVQP